MPTLLFDSVAYLCYNLADLWNIQRVCKCNTFFVSTSSAMKGMNETILLYRIRAKRDQDAFAKLYDLYIERIYRFVYIKISHKQEAEDLTSDIFLKTWYYLTDENNRQIKSFSGLIYRIARNRIIDWYRNKSKRDLLELEAAADVADTTSLHEQVASAHDAANILDTIRTLKQEYQEIVLLRYIEEMSIAEIAEIVGKKRTAVRVTLHRAMKKIKDLIDQQT